MNSENVDDTWKITIEIRSYSSFCLLKKPYHLSPMVVQAEVVVLEFGGTEYVIVYNLAKGGAMESYKLAQVTVRLIVVVDLLTSL